VIASRYRDQVAAALAAATVRGPTRYAWLGRMSRRLPLSVDAELDDDERRRYLASCLREELYFSFYCHGGPVPARWGAPEPVSADHGFLEALSRANTGHGTWEPGWTVEHVEGEEAVVATPRLRVRVAVSDCHAAAGAVHEGDSVSVHLPSELPSLSPGFFTVLGDASDDGASDAGDVRVYWNVMQAGAPALVAMLTSRLNAEGVPYRFKIADHPFRLDRCDAAILYLDGEVFRSLRAALREQAAALAAHLRPSIPAFTLELAPGVGLAEDDAGESFGYRRCAPLAEAIVDAHERGIRRIEDRVEVVAARFAEDGVLIDAPYLEPSLDGRHVL